MDHLYDHQARACECGSVRWCLLRSGKIECHECRNVLAASWHAHIPTAALERAAEIALADNTYGAESAAPKLVL
jgi:hypothetical protein